MLRIHNAEPIAVAQRIIEMHGAPADNRKNIETKRRQTHFRVSSAFLVCLCLYVCIWIHAVNAAVWSVSLSAAGGDGVA